MREIIQCRFYNQKENKFYYSGGTPSMQEGFWEHISVAFCKDEGELSYSTGLKDKNGKEIYEGDIVEDYLGKNKLGSYLVVWDSNNARFAQKSIGGELYSIFQYEKCEVIGNKFEHSNLLN